MYKYIIGESKITLGKYIPKGIFISDNGENHKIG